MSSSPFASLTNDMVVDSPVPAREPGELFTPARHQGLSSRGRGNRHCNGRGGRGRHSSLRESQNSDAMGAFTRFFRAKAEAKKLAIRKEAHTFDELLCSECRLWHSHSRPRAPTICLWTIVVSDVPLTTPVEGTPGLQSEDLPGQQLMLPTASPHPTAALLFKHTLNLPTPRLSTPFTSAPTSPDTAIDHSSDVAELIAEAEQMDLEAEARCAGFSSTEEMFGRVLLACSLMMNALTLLVLLAAMNIQTAQAAQP
ncbi:hypothetical protein F4604DRAFT_1690745 [Suillus subluteus]|nr:hypothetical protein F4604DRAFT_1690745 [Suillus subluteus]